MSRYSTFHILTCAISIEFWKLIAEKSLLLFLNISIQLDRYLKMPIVRFELQIEEELNGLKTPQDFYWIHLEPSFQSIYLLNLFDFILVVLIYTY